MNQLRRFFFASPADIGIEKYSVDEIVERMRPEPGATPKLSLRFARVILELVAEAQSTKDETPNHALQRTGAAVTPAASIPPPSPTPPRSGRASRAGR